MSSSATSTPPSSKLPPPSSGPSYSQAPSSTGLDSFSRRNNHWGGVGAGSVTRHVSQPRNNQTLRKQHKTPRRPRLVDEDAMAESAAMRSINSRKGQTSITHLMNFALPPRPHQHPHPHHWAYHRHQRRNPTWGLGSGYHAIDKARYVHANYRFIVRPDREYQAQMVDADVHLSWDAVLQVLASEATQSTSCPICLCTPVAPRMAKCGHIFCLPCLIRYMHSTDDSNPGPEKRARWKKCPICEDSIYISETRPVRFFTGQEASMLREGGDVLLKLLKREPGTALALPRDTAESYGKHNDIPWYHVAEMMDYARFMKGGENYMAVQYDQEVAELEAQEKEDEIMFGDDNTWTKKAIHAIEDAKQKLSGLGNPPAEPKSPAAQSSDAVPPSWETTDEENDRQPGTSGLAEAVQSLALKRPADPARSVGSKQPAADVARPPSHPFYFYHALPNFFLSPLDIRILKAAFGDFSAFPSTILPRIEHISTGHVIDDDLRKRAKYMAHLPYGCEVTFLECDWTDIISPVILGQFDDDIMRRRKRNQEKEAREERDRLRAEREEEEKRWASTRRRRPSLVGKSFSESDFQPLVHPDAQLGSSPGDSTMATTPPWGNARTHSSFATLASPGTSPDAPRTVWGTAAVPPTTPPLVAAPEEPSPDDGWLQGWERDLLDEHDVLSMVDASINGDSIRSRPAGGTSKKGKKKKITLMTTNNRRGA